MSYALFEIKYILFWFDLNGTNYEIIRKREQFCAEAMWFIKYNILSFPYFMFFNPDLKVSTQVVECGGKDGDWQSRPCVTYQEALRIRFFGTSTMLTEGLLLWWYINEIVPAEHFLRNKYILRNSDSQNKECFTTTELPETEHCLLLDSAIFVSKQRVF